MASILASPTVNIHLHDMSGFGPLHISPKSGKPGFAITSTQASQFSPDHLSSSAEPTGKRRKMSKVKSSPTLKRAVSTPHMGGLGDSDSGALSPSALDKRRNKLGYQRISIACGHCRRRKIRCVLAEADDHGRCQNCIRLKKECVFYPVDSTGGVESRAQHKTGLGSKSSSVMSNSPSERKPNALVDGEREFARFPPLASNAPSDLASISSGSGLGISTGSSIITSEFGYDPAASTRDGWQPGVFHHNDSANSEPSTAGSWRVQDSPRGDFPAFPSSDGPPAGPYSGYHYPSARGEYGMQPPLRSMSYGNIEPQTMGSFPSSASTHSLEFNRPPTQYTLPSSTDASHVPNTSSMIDPTITPVATEAMPQFGGYSPQWSYYNQTPQAASMEYGRHDSVNMHWYQPAQVGQGLEEQGRQQQQHHHQQQHHQHQQQQQQQQQQHQHWQQHQHNLMLPPGSGYKGQSPS